MQIALYRGVSLTSKLIRLQTRGPYSHAAVSLTGGGLIESWQFGKGVRETKSLSDGHTSGTRVDLFDVQLTSLQEEVVETYLRSQVGKKYDWITILRFLTIARAFIGGSRDDPDKLVCSELVFEAYFLADKILLERTKPHEVSPNLLGRSPLLVFSHSVLTT